ncbi:MAG: acylphosphatase, partial [Bacteroidales bacterium]
MNLKQYEIEIRGLVQGVGFRPYVYKLATEMNLKGYVNNDSRGVNVFLEASVSDKDKFLKRLYAEKPDVA